jgi:hypothetical protein
MIVYCKEPFLFKAHWSVYLRPARVCRYEETSQIILTHVLLIIELNKEGSILSINAKNLKHLKAFVAAHSKIMSITRLRGLKLKFISYFLVTHFKKGCLPLNMGCLPLKAD